MQVSNSRIIDSEEHFGIRLYTYNSETMIYKVTEKVYCENFKVQHVP